MARPSSPALTRRPVGSFAAARGRGAEGAVAAVAVLERVRTCGRVSRWFRWGGRQVRREQGGEPVREDGRGAPHLLGQARRQDPRDGLGVDAALQPGRHGGCEPPYVAFGQQQPRVAPPQPDEQVGRPGVQPLGFGSRLRLRLRSRVRLLLRSRVRVRYGFPVRWRRRFARGGARLVVRVRAGHHPPARQPLAPPLQVAVPLQLPQGGGDPHLPFREAAGKGLDADRGTGGERLDVGRDADRRRGQLLVLEEVVADHGVVTRVPSVDVDDTGSGGAGGNDGRGARGRARVLWSHWEAACYFLVGQALGRDASPTGGRLMSGVVAASICPPTHRKSSSVDTFHPTERRGPGLVGGLVLSPGSLGLYASKHAGSRTPATRPSGAPPPTPPCRAGALP